MSTELKDSQVSLRLPGELKSRVESYAQLTGRSKSYVAMQALNDYLDWRLPQIEDLKAAVAAADAGDFASDDEVATLFASYTQVAPTPSSAKPARAARRK